MKLILFDDRTADLWEPFALTRPAGELLFGALTTRARAEQIFGIRAVAHLAAGHLAGFEEEGAPPVHGLGDAPGDGHRLFLSSRFVPAWEAGVSRFAGGDTPVALRCSGRVVGWLAPAGSPAPPADFLADPDAFADPPAKSVEVAGVLLERVWELIVENPEQLARDLAVLYPDTTHPPLPRGADRLGEHPLTMGDGVTIEPGVVFDCSHGPVRLGSGVTVRAFTRLAGPGYVGAGSVILGGSLEAVSIGPLCKVRGELAESVCLGYVNKAHDGQIGHAYLGRWVNLGAETTNSDLKNSYGTIRIWTPAGEVDSGQIKLGSLLGDHAKTGIGLLLNTGTVIGAGSNLFGAAMPPKYVPPFSWGSGSDLGEYRLDKFLQVAGRVMERRGVALSEGMKGQLSRAWRRGRAEPGG
ncbi:MAG: putative sugar nucleotidyl transferase [Longimicrobiaceae bacterium]